MIAFTSDATGNGDIWVQSAAELSPTRLTSDEARDSQPSWSPDGRWIVVSVRTPGRRNLPRACRRRRRAEAIVVRVPSPLVSHGPADHVFESVDPNRTSRGVRRGRGGGAPRRVATDVIGRFIAGTTSMGWLNSVNVNWHPDGTRISVWGQLPDRNWQFVTVSESGGTSVVSQIPDDIRGRLRQERLDLGRFSWAPSGRYLYFEGQSEETRNIWRVAIDPTTLAWRDGPERLTTGASADGDIAVSADGSRIAFTARTGRTRVWELELDPHTKRLARIGAPLTSGNAGEIDLDASRDGTKLAYRTTRAGRTEVWQLDTHSRTERLLVASADWRPSTPRWSLDGRRLAYTRPQPGGTDAVVALLSPEAGDEQVVTLPEGAHLVPSDWSADGAAILSSCRLAPADSMAVCLLTHPAGTAIRVGANSRARRHQEPVGAAVLSRPAMDCVCGGGRRRRGDVPDLRRAGKRRQLDASHRRALLRRQASMVP